MTPALADFRAAYAAAFQGYLDRGTELELRAAYELGREAVARELSVLDLTLVHHEALADALSQVEGVEVAQVTRAAAAFVLESLSAYEMVRRGFTDAREAAVVERRKAVMLRQLSGFLADVSLARTSPADPMQEMLQLVAEQALELEGCEWCRVRVSTGRGEEREALSDSRGVDAPPSGFEGHSPQGGVLTAPLTALDGRVVGSITVASKRHGRFTRTDEAVLGHLAHMVSAAVERTRLYNQEDERT